MKDESDILGVILTIIRKDTQIVCYVIINDCCCFILQLIYPSLLHLFNWYYISWKAIVLKQSPGHLGTM